MAGRMTCDWEEAYLPDGELVSYGRAVEMTRTLTDRLGITVEITNQSDPDEAGRSFLAEGWYDPDTKTIVYPGCADQGEIPESTVLHKVAHAWRDQVWGYHDEHDPVFLGLLISLHRDHHPDGWWAESGGEILQAAADAGCLPPFTYTELPHGSSPPPPEWKDWTLEYDPIVRAALAAPEGR